MKKLISVILALALLLGCAAAIADEAAEDQVGVYTVYNVTGETVTEITITDNVTGEKSENLAGEGLAPDASAELTWTLPAGEDGHHRLTLAFKTESGYEGSFATLSIEVAPISLLSADAMTGATMISFKVPQQTGTYTIYNTTGEKVTGLMLIDNVTGENSGNLLGEEGLEADAWIVITKSIPVTEDGHHRLTLAFSTESGYQGGFPTLSIEVAPISLLSADAMTGATQIAFKAVQQTGVYTIYNVTGETVTELYLTDNVTGDKSENFAGEGLAADASIEITKSLAAAEDGHHRLTLSFKTESGYEGSFGTLSIEVAPISLLSADAMTGATMITFKAPAAE